MQTLETRPIARPIAALLTFTLCAICGQQGDPDGMRDYAGEKICYTCAEDEERAADERFAEQFEAMMEFDRAVEVRFLASGRTDFEEFYAEAYAQ